MLALLKLVPGISQFLQWAGDIGIKLYSAKLSAEGAHEAKTVEIAIRQIALDETEARLNAQAKTEIRGRWYAPENLMFYLIVFPYWFMVITVDYLISPMFGWGHVTLPLRGDTAKVMMIVVAFWFGKRMVGDISTTVAQIFKK